MKHARTLSIMSTLLLFSSLPVHAATLAPRRPSDLLTLSVGVPGSPGCPLFGSRFDQVVSPDGTLQPFAGIPAGKVFVVTGVNWGGTGVTASRDISGAISVQNGANFTSVVGSNSLSDAAGKVGTRADGEALGVIKAGPVVCFSISSGFTTMGAQVSGYLAKDN